jgi:cyanophycinase
MTKVSLMIQVAAMANGYLMPIGGAEDKTNQRVILSRFVEVAGGNTARIVIVPTASSTPHETAQRYVTIFTELGAASVQAAVITERAQANDPESISGLDDATGIFLTGGVQVKLVSIIGGTRFAEKIQDRYAQGAIVAGTSAGASALSRHMIAFGDEGVIPHQHMVQLAPGLDLMPRLIIDQHFNQRNRVGRLILAVTYNPGLLGVGIDEDTALLIGTDHQCEVIGAGSVMIIDGSGIEFTDAYSVHENGKAVSVMGLKVHMLSQGYRYHLDTGRAPG